MTLIWSPSSLPLSVKGWTCKPDDSGYHQVSLAIPRERRMSWPWRNSRILLSHSISPRMPASAVALNLDHAGRPRLVSILSNYQKHAIRIWGCNLLVTARSLISWSHCSDFRISATWSPLYSVPITGVRSLWEYESKLPEYSRGCELRGCDSSLPPLNVDMALALVLALAATAGMLPLFNTTIG